MIPNTDTTWGWPAKLLHWIGAILILLLLGHGWWMTHMAPRGPIRLEHYAGHAALGYDFLLLLVLRLLWRWTHAVPSLPADMPRWERLSAQINHGLLYCMMLATTLVGWALAGTMRVPMNKDAFGVTVPLIYTSQDRAMHGLFEDTHKILAYILAALVLVHVVAALRHHLIKHNNVLQRMWFGKSHDMTRLLIALLVVFASLPARAQDDVAAFYKGKTVRLLVGIGVGSGYDINARLLARFLPKYIPGNPTVIVQNQPGAGSLSMTNQLYAGGPFDGTAIGASFNGLPTTPLLQPVGARFEAVKLNWVGSTNRETQAMYVWHTAPIQTLGDLTSAEMIVGAQAPGSTQYDYPKLAEKLFGWKFKVITGYEATPKIHLAMERGEVHGTWANWSTLKAIAGQWIDEKKIRILAQWALRKHPALPGVPLILEQAKTEEQKQALDLALARLEFGRPFFMPPNVPAERVDAIRRAFDATMKDKEFLEEADKLKIEIDPLSGEQVAALIVQIYKTPAETVARVRDAMAPK